MYERFLELLKAKRLTVADVSRATGISKATFSLWKNGQINLKTEKVVKIADFLNVSVDYLTYGKNAPEYVMPDYDSSQQELILNYAKLNDDNKNLAFSFIGELKRMQLQYEIASDNIKLVKEKIFNFEMQNKEDIKELDLLLNESLYTNYDLKTDTIELPAKKVEELSELLGKYNSLLNILNYTLNSRPIIK